MPRSEIRTPLKFSTPLTWRKCCEPGRLALRLQQRILTTHQFHPSHKARLMLARKLVLPDADDAPVGPPQGAVHQPVARDVAGEFLFPERRIAFGLRAMPGAAMPETTIHEDREP